MIVGEDIKVTNHIDGPWEVHELIAIVDDGYICWDKDNKREEVWMYGRGLDE